MKKSLLLTILLLLSLNPLFSRQDNSSGIYSYTYYSVINNELSGILKPGINAGLTPILFEESIKNGKIKASVGEIDDIKALVTSPSSFLKNTPECTIYGNVRSYYKISDTTAGFAGSLTEGERFGNAAKIGDVDGDGNEDIAIGAISHTDIEQYAGAVWIIFLDEKGKVKNKQMISENSGNFNAGIDYQDYFGIDICPIGDFNGDSIPDIAVGAYYDDDMYAYSGAVYLIFLNRDGTVKEYKKLSALNNVDSLAINTNFGSSVESLGDLDNNGTIDLMVGVTSYGYDYQEGAVKVLFLNADGTVKAQRYISDHTSGFDCFLDAGDRFGADIANLGDLDGDSINDVAVAATLDDDGGSNRGALYILFLNKNGSVKKRSKISSTQGNFTNKLDDNDNLYAVSCIGDIDGDSIQDIAAGAWKDSDNGSEKGALYIISLNKDGSAKTSFKISDTTSTFQGILKDGDHFGGGPSYLGDINKDGYIEVAVTARDDDDGGLNKGACYILTLCTKNYSVAGTIYAKTNLVTNGDVYLYNTSKTVYDNYAYKTSINNGLYTFENVLPGNYKILAVPASSYSDFYPTYYLKSLDWDNAIPVEVASTINNLDISLLTKPSYQYPCNTYGNIMSYIKISDTTSGFAGSLVDGDRFGNAAKIGDVDGDGNDDIAVGAISHTDVEQYAGAVWIIFLDENGKVKNKQLISENSGNFNAGINYQDYFGIDICSIGDFNGDSIPDIAVGAYYDDDKYNYSGAVYLIFLNRNGTVKEYKKLSALNNIDSLSYNTNFGSSVESLGDLDNDGTIDLIVGVSSYGYDYQEGAVKIVFLNADGTVKAQRYIADHTSGFDCSLDAQDRFGADVANLGDLDGDSIPDVAVAATLDDDGGTNRGAIYILFLNKNGSVKKWSKISSTQGNFSNNLDDYDNLYAVTCIGDIDGDNIQDIAAGAWRDSDNGAEKGALYIISLNNDGAAKSSFKISDTTSTFQGILADGDHFGGFPSFLGDFNKDGYIDVLVAAKDADDGGPNKGALYILSLCTKNNAFEGSVFADNELVSDGEVRLYNTNRTIFESFSYKTSITNGQYTFDKILPGNYKILAIPGASYLADYLPTYYLKAADWDNALPINVKSQIIDLDIHLLNSSNVNINNTQTMKSSYQIYPNPVADEVIINATGKNEEIFLISATGKVIKYIKNNGENLNKLRIKECEPGIYILVIKSDNEFFSFKVVKN